MTRFWKTMPILALALLVPFGIGVCAGEEPPVTVAAAPPDADKNGAKSLIEDILAASRSYTIYGNLRRSTGDVYLPLLKAQVQGNLPVWPIPDAQMAAALTRALTFLDYAHRASVEADAGLNENREEIISDAADVLARYASPGEVAKAHELLQLPAVRKGFDALYAMTEMSTSLSYDEARSIAEFSAWAQQTAASLGGMFPGASQAERIPSAQKMAKAQSIVANVLAVSRFDETVENVRRFARDVYAETAVMTDEDRQAFRDQIAQFEFTYNLQKSIALAAAPAVLASALKDDQLDTMDAFFKSPAAGKLFALIASAVKASTAFSKDEVLAARDAIAGLATASKNKRSPEEIVSIDNEWNKFLDKWSKVLGDRLSPETRSGLTASFQTLTSAPPI